MAVEKKRSGKHKKSYERIPVIRLVWWWVLVPPVVTFLFYIPALSLGWTNWDDPRYILENEAILSQNWGALLTQSFVGNFHPVTMLSLGLDHLVFGENPGGYHLVNVLLHSFTTVWVYLIFSKMSRNGWVGLFCALWFGIHPMHVESVAWIAERKDVLYGLFFITGLFMYQRFQDNRTAINYGGTFLLFLFAVLSKAMAVVFPIALFLMDYWKEGSFKAGLRDWKAKIPFFLVAIGLGIVALQVQQAAGAVSKMEVLSWYNRLTVGLFALPMYVIKLLFPFHLSNVYPYPRITAAGMLPFQFYLLAAVGIAMLGIIYPLWKRNKMLVFWSLSFYIVTTLLVLQWISVGSAVLADRYTYVSSLGMFFLWAGGTSIHLHRFQNGKIWMTLLAIVTLAFGVATWSRISVWQDSETLWRDMINKYPNRFATAYKNLGNDLAQKGRIAEAHQLLTNGANLDPFDAELQESLGNINSMEGKVDQAIRLYDEALKIDPNLVSVYQNRGIAYSIKKEFNLALNDFDKALALGLPERQILPNRSFTLLSMGRLKDAIDGFLKCIEFDPNDGSYDYFLSQAYYYSGDLLTAKKYLNSAKTKGYTSISPDYEAKLQ